MVITRRLWLFMLSRCNVSAEAKIGQVDRPTLLSIAKRVVADRYVVSGIVAECATLVGNCMYGAAHSCLCRAGAIQGRVRDLWRSFVERGMTNVCVNKLK